MYSKAILANGFFVFLLMEYIAIENEYLSIPTVA
jgi:hypothetical protein